MAVVAPGPTGTDDGTVRAAVLLESATVTPPAPAASPKFTVQVVEAFDAKLATGQDRELTNTVFASWDDGS